MPTDELTVVPDAAWGDGAVYVVIHVDRPYAHIPVLFITDVPPDEAPTVQQAERHVHITDAWNYYVEVLSAQSYPRTKRAWLRDGARFDAVPRMTLAQFKGRARKQKIEPIHDAPPPLLEPELRAAPLPEPLPEPAPEPVPEPSPSPEVVASAEEWFPEQTQALLDLL